MQHFISAIIGYVLGSIPTAYLLLKITRGIDIRETGSGNVGAFNSIAASNSKIIGIIVLIIDFSKGMLTAYLIGYLYPDVFILQAVGILAAVLSHNYNFWLKFKGGRGLATAAGGAAIIFPFLLAVWCLLWVISYLYKKNVIIANVFASVLSLLLIFSVVNIAVKYTYPSASSNFELILFSTILLLLILAKHLSAFKEEIKKLNLPVRGSKNAN